ncbi:MAG: contractile injection system protein, VgrG/Pvc8 family [Myxococcota bacterium]|nr:contractile injection system protein, VgrG/Pvc8 family [Myxococcota bacterium]
MKESHSSATSYEVTVGSASFEQPENDGLEMLVVEDHVDMVDLFTMRVGGAEGQPTWGFSVGDTVEAKVGQGTSTIFRGEVTALEPAFQVDGGAKMVIRSLDHMHRLGRGRKTRFWEDMKDSDVVSEVGAECGLSVSADATDETLPYILQRNESNVAFLKRLAARNNFLLRVEGESLVFKKVSFEGSSVDIGMGDKLRSLRFTLNSVDQVQQVIVRGWDITKKEAIVGKATCDEITSIGGGKIGASVVTSAFSESTAYVTDVPVSSQGLANLIAKSEIERLCRQFCRGTCVIKGNDLVRAGTMVSFSGLPTDYNGSFYVVSSRHIVSQRTGYSTEFKFCSNTYGT